MNSITLISSDGCSRGYHNILPIGIWAEKCINFINDSIREQFQLHQISFPSFYNPNDEAIITLTKKFKESDDIFYIKDENLALSYSPDPNLFLWLKNKEIDEKKLPYSIETWSTFFRKTKSGGINGLDRVRQFAFPVIFSICTEINAKYVIIKFLNYASQIMNLIYNDNWKLKIMVSKGFFDDNKQHFMDIQKVTGKVARIDIQNEQTRYFTYKLGLYGDAIYSDLMAFNLQWDNTNAKQFNITTKKNPLIIIHKTMAGGINRIYPAVIAQSLKRNIHALSPILAPFQLGIIDENDMNKSILFKNLIDLCKSKFIRYNHSKMLKPKSKRLEYEKFWVPYIVTIREEMEKLDDLEVLDRINNQIINFNEFINYIIGLPTTKKELMIDKTLMEFPF